MENQIQKSSIKHLLHADGIQHAFGRVRSASLQEEMSLIGFIPYGINENLSCDLPVMSSIDLNEHLIVTPHLLRFASSTRTFPIFKSIKKAMGNRYRVDKNLVLCYSPKDVPEQIVPNNCYLDWRHLNKIYGRVAGKAI